MPSAPNTTTNFATTGEIELLKQFGSSASLGISSYEATKRLSQNRLNVLQQTPKTHILWQYLSRFKDPLMLLLLVVALISILMGEILDAVIVLLMIILSATLNFFQEYKASQMAAKLQQKLATKAMVLRDSKPIEIPTAQVCVGDILILNAGDLIPADGRILEAKDCYINQSALTGESLPVNKQAITLQSEKLALPDMLNMVFAGTSLVTGTAKALVVATGSNTQFGQIAVSLAGPQDENDFTKGVKHFGIFILRTVIAFVLCVFFFNWILKGDFVQSLAFSIAIAVGLTPEFLPMIMSVAMGIGSVKMAEKGVIVKKLTAIPTFGSMDVLCTDKTGTLTQDKIKLVKYLDTTGKDSPNVLFHAYLNSSFQTGITNPMDQAVVNFRKLDISQYRKIDEIPFDFVRKKMSVIVQKANRQTLVCKGAPEEIVKVCSHFDQNGINKLLTSVKKREFVRLYDELSAQGYRVLAVACKNVTHDDAPYDTLDENRLTLLGFTAFLDPAKPDARQALDLLEASGIEIKVITGDNELVAAKICQEVGVNVKGMLMGFEVAKLTDKQLDRKVENITIFARFAPDEKNRVIASLRRNGHVVGYMGDGINDAPSLQTADVGISVANAVDVAKEAADFILTQKNLQQLYAGVLEGRKTFGNTLKYIYMGLSSNFGNMFSVLGAVIFLPFLPMLPIQILLANFLYDFSQLTIPSDDVDAEYLRAPKRWDLHFIKKFMLVFGPISSFFDFLTFATLYWLFGHNPAAFQTGWFIEGLATQVLVIYVIRTKKIPFLQSKPSKYLVLSTLAVVFAGWLITVLPIGSFFGFVNLPLSVVALMYAIVLVYLVVAEIGKQLFYRWIGHEKHYHHPSLV